MQRRTPKNNNRLYHVLLIPADGDAKRLTSAWADSDQAAAFGVTQAEKLFATDVEVVVIHTMQNEAVSSVMVRRIK